MSFKAASCATKTALSACPISPASASSLIARNCTSTANSTSASAATPTIGIPAAPAGRLLFPTTVGPIPKTTARFPSPADEHLRHILWHKALPCASERSSDLEFGHFQVAAPHRWGMLQ